MTLTSPNCPVAETLPLEIEEKVKDLKAELKKLKDADKPKKEAKKPAKSKSKKIAGTMSEEDCRKLLKKMRGKYMKSESTTKKNIEEGREEDLYAETDKIKIAKSLGAPSRF